MYSTFYNSLAEAILHWVDHELFNLFPHRMVIASCCRPKVCDTSIHDLYYTIPTNLVFGSSTCCLSFPPPTISLSHLYTSTYSYLLPLWPLPVPLFPSPFSLPPPPFFDPRPSDPLPLCSFPSPSPLPLPPLDSDPCLPLPDGGGDIEDGDTPGGLVGSSGWE